MSRYHKEALDHLLYGIRERKGFIILTGGIGTGKTTLCRVLLDQLKNDTRSALIFNSFISDIELLKSVNQEFGLPIAGDTGTKKTYIDALNQFLLEIYAKGENAIVLIDEAQNLSRDVMEQIRMLSNLETEKEKLVQIILVGQPELKEVLSTNSLKQLDERITVRYEIKALAYEDIRSYVEHRLAVAGGRGDIKFSAGAVKKIYLYSQGNPRRINSVCDRALLAAYVAGKQTITSGTLSSAIKDLQVSPLAKKQYSGWWSWKGFFTSAFLIILLISAAGLGGWIFRQDISDKFIRGQINEPVEVRAADNGPDVPEDILLDERQSLSGLYALWKEKIWSRDDYEPDLNLVHYNLQPEHYVTLKKPFRVIMKDLDETSPSSRYLLISRIGGEGAFAVDSAGKEKVIKRDYLLKNWGYKVTCIYPFGNGNIILNRGMKNPDVLKLQDILKRIGYLLDPTGVYDEDTFRNIKRFQKDFGLLSDGIAGPRTLALLYQLKEFDERHK
ncbi:MAG: AAA family ATPase [Deltaproteobacteria bacterium]|nr:AAA family ATPase [Deltaproteobacteria bacterium]